MPTANPAHIAALLNWARANKMPRLASYSGTTPSTLQSALRLVFSARSA